MYSNAALTVSVSRSGDKESWMRDAAIIDYKNNEMMRGFDTHVSEMGLNITQTLPCVGVFVVPGVLEFHGSFQQQPGTALSASN